MKVLRLVPIALACALFAGCSSDNPTRPDDTSSKRIAGGGRQASDDPFRGGPEDSGPAGSDSILIPPDSIPYGGLMPLFYSDRDCAAAPGRRVIRNDEEWQAWWTAATECLRYLDQEGHGPDGMHDGMMDDSTMHDSTMFDSTMHDSIWGDSGIVWPDTLINPYPDAAPVVDFGAYAVVVISLEPDSLFGRSLWVSEVAEGDGGAVVRYQVTTLGDDCLMMLERMSLWAENSPTVAVQVPLPVSEPVTWERTDEVINCTWEPDPSIPLTVYYTDADCDLGSGETIIRDREGFDAWIHAAFACDSVRWYKYVDTTIVWPDSMGPTDPVPMGPCWWEPEIDFSTHAVIILRAGVQTRWGGGVWLDKFEGTEAGTVVEYTAMEPADDCPPVDLQPVINPTVAIRVPLPAGDPITWTRQTQVITCDWTDSLRIEPGSDGGW